MIFNGAPYPIVTDPRGYFRTQSSLEQVKSNLLILLLTNPGERVMLPNFGVPLRTLIFEPNDQILALLAKQMIIKAIALWEPRITIKEITVGSVTDNRDPRQNSPNILSIRITFFDPENIQKVQQLVLEVPLSGNGN